MKFTPIPKSLLSGLVLIIFFIISQKGACKTSEFSSIGDSSEVANQPWDKFSVSLGGFFANYNSGITLGSEQLGLGVLLNMEDAFGLESSTWAFRSKVNFRFGRTRKHVVSVGYFQINRRAFKTLSKDVEIGDLVIPLGTEFSTTFNFAILRTKYDYSFYQDDRISLGASIGLFIMPLSFSIQVKDDKSETADLIAPLPVVGLRADFLITEKFFFRQSLELLYLAFDGFSGSIVDLDLSLEYRPIKQIGVGLGLNSTKLELRSTGNSYPNIEFFGNITSDYIGLYLFAKYNL